MSQKAACAPLKEDAPDSDPRLLLAAGVAALVGVSRSWLILPFYDHAARRRYHLLFAPLISRGWVER